MSIDRRNFLKSGLSLAGAATLASCPVFPWITRAGELTANAPLLAIASGESPAENVRRAFQALGGIEKFVKQGSKVFLKPNSFSKLSEDFAINTNPAVVGEVARLCRLAGASQVIAATHDEDVWEVNGIGAALKAEGVLYRSANRRRDYQPVALPKGKILAKTEMLKELIEADVFINIPVLKHSPEVYLTAGLKNTMGLNWDRQIMHQIGLHQTIADLASFRIPDVTVIDCTRILLSNGPYGPGEVRRANQVLASGDPVAADAYAATLLKLEPREVDHIRFASDLGLGEMDVKKIEIRLV